MEGLSCFNLFFELSSVNSFAIFTSKIPEESSIIFDSGHTLKKVAKFNKFIEWIRNINED